MSDKIVSLAIVQPEELDFLRRFRQLLAKSERLRLQRYICSLLGMLVSLWPVTFLPVSDRPYAWFLFAPTTFLLVGYWYWKAYGRSRETILEQERQYMAAQWLVPGRYGRLRHCLLLDETFRPYVPVLEAVRDTTSRLERTPQLPTSA